MKTQIAAIEFGTSKIVTVIAQNGGIDRLDIIGSGTVPYDGYTDGDWNTPGQMIQRVRDSISAAELEAGTKIREIYVGVPGEYIHVRSTEAEVELPEGEVTPEAVNAVQDAAADQLNIAAEGGLVLHRSPSWYAVDDGKRSMMPRGKGSSLRAMTTFIIADPLFIQDVTEMISRQDITILGFLSTSMGEVMLALGPDERDKVAVLIDVGYLNTEISVAEGDAIIYHAMLPRGGGHITADLAMGLRIPMRAAEQIKRNYVFTPDEFDQDSFSEAFDDRGRRMTFRRERVSAIVEKSFGELADMIEQTIANDAAPLMNKRAHAPIFLTGGGIALMRGAREALSARVGRPVKVAVAKSSKLNSPVFTSTLGLADLVFNSIESVDDEPEKFGSKLKNLFTGKA